MTNNESSGQSQEDSKIEIEDVIYDDEITNGDIIKVKLKIYKGNTGKKSLKLWAEGSGKISEITSLSLEDKFREYDVTLPIRLKDDCKIQSGRYNVIVEGLDIREKEKIKLEFKACKKEIAKTSINNEENKTKKVSQIKKVSEKKTTADNKTLTQLNPRTIYQSPDKSKNEKINLRQENSS